MNIIIFVVDLISYEGDHILGYHTHENTVNTAETQLSDTRRSGDSENQHDRKAERKHILPPVNRKESGEFTSLNYVTEFTILNVPGWQIVGRMIDDFFFPPFKNANEKSFSDQGSAFVINSSKSTDKSFTLCFTANSFCEYFSSIAPT